MCRLPPLPTILETRASQLLRIGGGRKPTYIYIYTVFKRLQLKRCYDSELEIRHLQNASYVVASKVSGSDEIVNCVSYNDHTKKTTYR